MNLLSELREASKFDPSKERKELSIYQLCTQIESGKIILPVFQTYIRWTNDKVIQLFEYQLFGKAPVAPISINLIDDPTQVIEQISFLDRKLLKTDELVGKLSVADGQQRLSTNYRAFIDHPDFYHIVFDLKKGKFIDLEGNQPQKHQIRVGILYNKDQQVYLEHVNSNTYLRKDSVKDLLSDIRRKHETYYYVVNFATNLSKEEQMDWFNKLNLAGSQVTHSMIYLTELLVKGVDFYKDYVNLFGDLLDEFMLGELFPRKTAEVSIPLATLNSSYYLVTGKMKTSNSSPIPSDAQPKLIGKSTVVEIREMINVTLNSLRSTLEFIDNEATLEKPGRIDIITYLVGLFVENDINLMNPNQKDFLTNWVSTVDFLNNSNKERRKKYEDLLKSYKELDT